MKTAPPWLLAVLGLALTCAGIAIAIAVVARRDAPQITYAGTPVVPPKRAADTILTDENGRPAHVVDPAFPATFLFFGYTHCPDECPLALASLARAYRGLNAADATRTRIVFVTVDPARDTPAVIKRYVNSFHAPIVGLTGSPAELARLWNSYGVQVNAESHEIGHGDAIYAIDASQRVVLLYTPDARPIDLRSDAEALASAK